MVISLKFRIFLFPFLSPLNLGTCFRYPTFLNFSPNPLPAIPIKKDAIEFLDQEIPLSPFALPCADCFFLLDSFLPPPL